MNVYKRKGKDVVLRASRVDGVERIIAASKSCDIQITTDMNEVSSVFSGAAKEFLPGRYSWQITCDALIYNHDVADFINICRTKKLTTVGLSVVDALDLHGYCYVQSFSANGAVGSMASYKLVLMGTGPLEITEVE